MVDIERLLWAITFGSAAALVIMIGPMLFRLYIWDALKEHLTRSYDPSRDYKNPLRR